MNYTCASCGSTVLLHNGAITRACACPADTGVLANATAHMIGRAAVNDEKPGAGVR